MSSSHRAGTEFRDAASTACAARARPRGDRGCDAARAAARARHRRPSVPRPARRRAARHVRVERCAKCDALGKSLGSNSGSATTRVGPAEDAQPRARALGAAAVGGVATAAYARVGGFGNGRSEAPAGRASAAAAWRRRRRRRSSRRAAKPPKRAPPPTSIAATVATVEEVVLLDVRGMHCGGCTANVKRILEMERACVSASVNLANESALVRVAVDVQEHTKYPYAGKGAEAMSGGGGVSGPRSDIARAVRAVGDGLAAVVTEKGFPTTVREACGVAVAGVSATDAAASKREERLRLRREEPAKRVVGSPGRSPRRAHRPRRAHVPPPPCPGSRCCAARPCTPA